ncbi:hypothetical protein PTI45_00469 [Paenibacillus nuruki]|uniref:Uncharacterized protein n=1 Tax=Paenibacillus nuruki TaxID=1886670 RepID=A0A1E3L8F3_9BACL|nr:hypothetical protein [Paenibacillus nuruki]ODP30016.1 hypothetical protein PTI45_00469 [Paenibacillus nuruki]
MTIRSSKYPYLTNNHTRNLMIGAVIMGLFASACTVGTGTNHATIQGESNSSYHNTYFVMGNRAVVSVVVVGVSIGISLGLPLTIKLYSGIVSRTK